MKTLIYSLLFISLNAISATAQVRCESLFSKLAAKPSTQEVSKKIKPLSQELLEQEGFRLTEEKDILGEKVTLLRDARDGDIIVGKVSTSTPQFLYQWGEAKYQQMNIQAGQIKNTLMRMVIERPPQTYGKGYYVSKDPFDASQYGTDVTVFKTKSNIVSIEQYAEGDSVDLRFTSTDLNYRLRRAGVEAVHSWKVENWYSFIDNRNLIVAKPHSLKDAAEWRETDAQLLNQFLIYNKLSKTGIERWLPPEHLLIKTIQKNISKDDLVRLKSILTEMKKYECDNSYGAGIGEADKLASINLLKEIIKSVK